MMQNRIKMATLVLLCYTFTGCGQEQGVLEEKKMRAVVWDMLMVEAYHQQLAMKDTSFKYGNRAKENEEKVFQMHGITRQQYIDTYKWYLERPEEMRVLMDSVSAGADRERAKMYQKKYGSSKPTGI
jgi:hypothetical protein